jgi:hypothetical protein
MEQSLGFSNFRLTVEALFLTLNGLPDQGKTGHHWTFAATLG